MTPYPFGKPLRGLGVSPLHRLSRLRSGIARDSSKSPVNVDTMWTLFATPVATIDELDHRADWGKNLYCRYLQETSSNDDTRRTRTRTSGGEVNGVG
jgi:hypothetical protein